MSFTIIQGRIADQTVRSDWAKEHQVTDKNAELRSLVIVSQDVATCWIQVFDSNNGADSSIPDEYPLPAGSVLSINDHRFYNGIYWRAVTAAGGSTPIGGDTCKGRADFQTGPLI